MAMAMDLLNSMATTILVSGGVIVPHTERPEAAGTGILKGRIAVQQISVQMQTNIRLEAFRKAFEHLNGKFSIVNRLIFKFYFKSFNYKFQISNAQIL